MAIFHYRLATMLRLRENERDRCRLELAEAQREEERIAARISQLNDELTRLERSLQKAVGPGRIDVLRLHHVQRHQQQLKADLQHAEAAQRAAAAEAERRRQMLLEADREVRTLEKHREQQLARHQAAELKLEIKQLDEQATQLAASRFGVKLRQLS